jgi:hypothetical protein
MTYITSIAVFSHFSDLCLGPFLHFFGFLFLLKSLNLLCCKFEHIACWQSIFANRSEEI